MANLDDRDSSTFPGGFTRREIPDRDFSFLQYGHCGNEIPQV